MKNRINHMDSIVDLSDNQRAKIEEINTAYHKEMKTLRSSGEKDHDQMKALRKKHKEEVEAVLTSEQLEKLKAAKAEMRKKKEGVRQEVKAYRDANIKPVLQTKRAELEAVLSDDEKSKIAQLRAELGPKPERNGEGRNHQRGHGKFDPEKRKEMKAQLAAVLNPIIEAHRSELDKIESDLKPLQDTWKADIKQMKEKTNPNCTSGDKCGKKRPRKGDKKEGHGLMKTYRFLLMEVDSE